MSHGGARNGAGRKKGVPGKKTQAVIAKAEAEGIMPKDVLLNAMRWCYAQGDFIQAAEIAKDAAPYFTPRLSAVATKTIEDELPNVSFLIEMVDEHGTVIAIPAPRPVASSTNQLPSQ